MDKTPPVNRGCKASPVRVIKPDGSTEVQPAYDINQLRRVQTGRKPDDVKASKAQRAAMARARRRRRGRRR